MNSFRDKLLEINSIDFEFLAITALLFFGFYLFSEFFVYLSCLLIPAYFTFRTLKEKAHENIQNKLMKYWMCFAFFSYPLKFITGLLLGNGVISNLIQILFFSNLYHPRSHLLEILVNPIQKIFIRYDSYFQRFIKGFFDGFEEAILKKKKNYNI